MGNITAAAATGGEERPAAAVGERRGSDYAERFSPNRQSQTKHFVVMKFPPQTMLSDGIGC